MPAMGAVHSIITGASAELTQVQIPGLQPPRIDSNGRGVIAGKIGIRDFKVMSLTRLFLTFCFKRDFSISRFGPYSPRSASAGTASGAAMASSWRGFW